MTIKRFGLAAVAALCAAGLSAPSLALKPATAAAAKPAKASAVLAEADVSPALILPPPPARGSAQEAAELAEVRRIAGSATPERLAQARADDIHEDPSIFDATIGGGFAAKRLPATWALLRLVQDEGEAAAAASKRYFNRTRPWGIDSTLTHCGADNKFIKSNHSYPSGHATLGYSVGFVLAELIPEKAQAIEIRAADYAYSRIVCAVHFRSDTEASHALGVLVATRLLAAPALGKRIAAARAELQAARFTAR